MTAPPRILIIAGSDSSGGAGIQADIKTVTMLGGYAMTAITAVTAQNSVGVQGITPLEGQFVGQQIASCLDDIGVDAIKIGMLQNEDIVRHVVRALGEIDGDIPIVLDPVMVATSGAPLVVQDAIDVIRDQLFPLANLLTPNLPELELLAGLELRDTGQVGEAAQSLAEEYGFSVLAKGGHTDDQRIIDILVPPDERMVHFDGARIDTRHTHGTGCTLASAIATLLGHGQSMEHAVRLARRFVREAIEKAPGFGAGGGPLGHQAVRLKD
ncbi:bifunctional hydroxymethylpyrimidine kinase/phosphomethylpyrimidine kinase [Parerythrobacter jejuensis]|uniref:hydroxymethylpyrimidine kinase n=1 Tax=Parerythrobacter jejuensis TaxID=795812 RepID=A0A845AWM9_9SPHN|nr:bifunctional hydroxymethylpyrimidine kinase/phosphomethylpyrimidine kinase [Parerythrobacter jejuensis]MXP30431.1 bifunctional hydroxymethylpyrimidine kinase/phosphomethylpyrimidine kinase [Parerythrobacter jejuensis]MXP33191.1 bifunctional hydroxymethylpyrimidine kinase/phosphomethylpyrimidine kinase [Parerythrobacter jejuensis]